MPPSYTDISNSTILWLKEVVIGFGFCPFAAKPFLENKIRIKVVPENAIHLHPNIVLEEIIFLENNPETETTLIVFSEAYEQFSAYLTMLRQSEKLLKRKGYEGEYQLASFHPNYVFADAQDDDAANYTNRSPYPMVHIIREASLSKAVQYHPNPDGIPQRNIEFARTKGLDFMKNLLASIQKNS